MEKRYFDFFKYVEKQCENIGFRDYMYDFLKRILGRIKSNQQISEWMIVYHGIEIINNRSPGNEIYSHASWEVNYTPSPPITIEAIKQVMSWISSGCVGEIPTYVEVSLYD